MHIFSKLFLLSEIRNILQKEWLLLKQGLVRRNNQGTRGANLGDISPKIANLGILKAYGE
jgi:hypothetical protein